MVFPIRRRGVNVGRTSGAILRRIAVLGSAALLVRVGVGAGVGVVTTGCNKRDVPRPDTTTTGAAASAKSADTGNVVHLAPSQGELTTLLPAEVARARARNLKPFLELRADWCGPCRELESSMSDARMIDAFAGTYVIRLDVDDWQAPQLAAMGVDGRAIPVFFALDSTTGKATGRKIDGGAWADNIPANMAPPLKAFFTK